MRILSQFLYRLSIRNYSLLNESVDNFKIGIVAYPHLQSKINGYKGGDSTVNYMLKNIFEEKGYEVEYIEYEPDFLNNDKILKRMIAKLIGMPYIFSEKINHLSNYSILIVDSGINFHVNHPACINLFHYSFGGYREYVGFDWGTISHLRFIKLSIIQQLGSKKTRNVAVSDFLKMILLENKILVDHVIYNSVDTDVFKPQIIKIKKDYLYAGGYSYYGKGFDLLEKLAAKGLEIDCVTNYYNDKSRLTYLPMAAHENMPDVYNKYKLLFYPSRFESFGLVPLEAMACGLPVVISEVGIGSILMKYIPEFVVSGYDDVAADNYYNNAKKIMGDYTYYSNKAREFVLTQFSYNTFKRNWLDLIDNIRHNNNEGS